LGPPCTRAAACRLPEEVDLDLPCASVVVSDDRVLPRASVGGPVCACRAVDDRVLPCASVGGPHLGLFLPDVGVLPPQWSGGASRRPPPVPSRD